jgi:hypothetical protein
VPSGSLDTTTQFTTGPGDADWFRTGPVDPASGAGWTVTVQPVATDPSLAEWMDPVVSVYDSTFHLLASSSTQTDQNGDVPVTVFAPGGPLYVQVRNLNPGSGSYTIAASATGTTGTPTAAGPRAWVLDSTPAARATDVQTDAVPTLTLGRAMDASTLTSSTVQLLDLAGAAVPGSVSYSAGTGVLTFTPGANLLTSMAYELVVNGAKDSLGNAMPETYLPFQTLFGSGPRPVTGLTAAGAPGTVTLTWTQPPMIAYNAATVRYAVGDVAPAWGAGTLATSGYQDGSTISGLDPTKDYSFSVFTQQNGTGMTGQTTTTVRGASDLFTVSPTTSAYLKPVTVTATLRDAGTLAPVVGHNAALYWRRTGTTAWTLIKVALTDANGHVTATSTPPWNAQYYLHDLGGAGRMGGVALTVNHPVTFDVSSRQTATRVVHGATVTLTGVVLPARAGAAVLLENYYGGAWHVMATGALNTNSAHAFPVTLRSAATYSFRFVKAGDTLLGTGVSPTFTVTAT